MAQSATLPEPAVAVLKWQVVETNTIDTGHASVLHDSWLDALAHAERICRNYRMRAKQALAFFDGIGRNS